MKDRDVLNDEVQLSSI